MKTWLNLGDTWIRVEDISAFQHNAALVSEAPVMIYMRSGMTLRAGVSALPELREAFGLRSEESA